MNPFSTYLNSLSAKTPSYGGLLTPNTNYGGLMSNLKAPNLSLAPKTTASPSAVAPVQTATNAPASSSSAKSTYVANLSNPASPSTSPVAVTPNPNQSQIDSTNSQIAALQAKVKSAQGAGYGNNDMISSDSTGAIIPKPVDQTPIQKYFSEYANATKSLASIQNQIDASTLSDREAQDAALAKSGGLLGGNDMSATAIGKQNADTLAKLGIAESGAARGVSALAPLQIGNSYIDPTTGNIIGSSNSGFTLSSGQTQYQLDPTTGKYTPVASNGGSAGSNTTYVPGANPTVDSWVQNINSGKAKLSDITGNETLKSQVSQGLAGTQSSSSELLNQTQTSLKELQDMIDTNHGFTGAVGFRGPIGTFTGPIGGTDTADFAAKAKQVVNEVVLPNLTLLHGLGRVTDREFQALSSALTSLSIDPHTGTSPLTQDAFKTEVKNITDRINALSNSSSSSSASSANTGNNVFAESWTQ